jgi:CHRD domain
MKAFKTLPLTAAIASAMLGGMIGAVPAALAQDGSNSTAARLSGYNEVHFIGGAAPALRGAISTKAKGSFKAKIDEGLSQITYELTFEGLESDVTQAHIHFGQRHTVGGIVVWLCQTATNVSPTPGTPQCGGPRSNTVTGTITPASVITVTGQGIDAGEFDELVRAIRAGATYTNVHSVTFGPGEIRGQNRGHGHSRD